MTKNRTLRMVENAGTLALVIREQTGTQAPKTDAYFLSQQAGTVTFSKHDGTRYDVTETQCSCPGHKYHGSKTTCKHRAAVARLVAMGKIRIQEVA